MTHTFRWRLLSIVALCALLGVVQVGLRSNLLGVTKGIAFLDPKDRVTGDGRSCGTNAVPWMRVAVMIERPEKKDGAWRFEFQTADDQKEIQSLQARGITEMDLNFPPLAAAIFPTSIPEVDSPELAKVHLITLSGVTRESNLATLRFEFGSETQRQELIFENIRIP